VNVYQPSYPPQSQAYPISYPSGYVQQQNQFIVNKPSAPVDVDVAAIAVDPESNIPAAHNNGAPFQSETKYRDWYFAVVFLLQFIALLGKKQIFTNNYLSTY
jgi:hypothetical protein